MALDHYSPCPCGSGKKLKFCKCVEQPHELERVIKLIEGGQEIAAVDRINHLLAKTPNAAWLLAIKAELSLGMGEEQTFRDTVERFLKLKPDNPLALILRSISSASSKEPVEQAARYLLQGIAESRENLPPICLVALELLLKRIEAAGKRSVNCFWRELLTTLRSNDGKSVEDAELAQGMNALARQPFRSLSVAPNSQCKERLAEVKTLTRSVRYEQAEAKLRAILRDFPDEPVALQGLIEAQFALLDQNGVMTTARKLSENLQLTFEERCFYGALALEVEPSHASLCLSQKLEFAEVDSEERVKAAMAELSCAAQLDDPDWLQNYGALIGDEVSARGLWLIRDVDDETARKKAEESSEPVFAEVIGVAALYGKQTDKPSRAILRCSLAVAESESIQKVLGALQLGEPLEKLGPPILVSYLSLFDTSRMAFTADGPRAVTLQEASRIAVDRFLTSRFTLLEDQTPVEAVQDEKKRFAVHSLLVHLECEQAVYLEPWVLPEIYAKLDLEFPAVAKRSKERFFLNVIREDATSQSDEELVDSLIDCYGLDATRAFFWRAREIRSRENFADRYDLRATALGGMVQVETDPETRLELLSELYECLRAIQAPIGHAVIEKMRLLSALGRHMEAQEVFETAYRDSPEDPVLVPFMQYMLSQSRAGAAMGGAQSNPDAIVGKMMGNAARTATADASGLVLPGQDSATASGESKLWLPGS